LGGSAVVVLTAGAAQDPGQTRLDLLEPNADIIGLEAEGGATPCDTRQATAGPVRRG